MAGRGGPQRDPPPAEHSRGVVSLVRRGEHFFCLNIFLFFSASITGISFRFPSRFHNYIPVFVTIAPVSRCCGPYLAVPVTASYYRLPMAYCIAVYHVVYLPNLLPKLVVVGSNPIARSSSFLYWVSYLFLSKLPFTERAHKSGARTRSVA